MPFESEHSPECDIIIYERPALCEAEYETVAVVEEVKAIVEIGDKLRILGKHPGRFSSA